MKLQSRKGREGTDGEKNQKKYIRQRSTQRAVRERSRSGKGKRTIACRENAVIRCGGAALESEGRRRRTTAGMDRDERPAVKYELGVLRMWVVWIRAPHTGGWGWEVVSWGRERCWWLKPEEC
jgi:hypothetical protein